MFCNHCGARVNNGSKFCNNCGGVIGDSGGKVPVNNEYIESYKFPPSFNTFHVALSVSLCVQVTLTALLSYLFLGWFWGTIVLISFTLYCLWYNDAVVYYRVEKDYERAYSLYRHAKTARTVMKVIIVIAVVITIIMLVIGVGVGLWGAGLVNSFY